MSSLFIFIGLTSFALTLLSCWSSDFVWLCINSSSCVFGLEIERSHLELLSSKFLHHIFHILVDTVRAISQFSRRHLVTFDGTFQPWAQYRWYCGFYVQSSNISYKWPFDSRRRKVLFAYQNVFRRKLAEVWNEFLFVRLQCPQPDVIWTIANFDVPCSNYHIFSPQLTHLNCATFFTSARQLSRHSLHRDRTSSRWRGTLFLRRSAFP